MKNHLLIDIGNTRLKWAVDSARGFEPGEGLLSSAISPDEIVNQVWNRLQPAHVLISCVGKQELQQQISACIATKWGLEAELLVSPAKGNGITNAYSQPEKLGSDRWAAMVAAVDQVNEAVCVVDCGTAVTLDVVTADGLHQGGLITPGLGLSRQCLQVATQMNFAMPESQLGRAYLGQSTEQCLQQGTLSAICGMINRTYQQTTQNYGAVSLILTGGDAELLQACLEYESLLVPDLVLKGLSVIQRSRMEVFSS